MPAAPYLTDDERLPLISDAGRALLKNLREHPHAPRFNMQFGDRLTRPMLDRVREYERGIGQSRDWLRPFIERCLTTVPFYRARARISPASRGRSSRMTCRSAI